MKETIQKSISKALKDIYDITIEPKDIHLERPQNESHGDWATNVAMKLSKEIKKSPPDIAKMVVNKLDTQNLGLDTHIAGPGFINFKQNNASFVKVISKILENKESFGDNKRLKGQRIMVEFAHPNPFKSFHIGHLRNIILGESLVRLFEAQGAEVIRVNYQGDVGMHIAKCLWAFIKVPEDQYPQSADEKVALLGKCYTQGATAFEEDDNAQAEIKAINEKIYSQEDIEINKLWRIGKDWSLEKFHEIYERVYTTFEREYMESETLPFVQDAISKALEAKILTKSQGAIVFDGAKYGLDTRVFINSQGLPTYEGKELGLAVIKNNEYGIVDLHVHNVAVEQISFFKVTFKVKELLWPEQFKDKQYHNAYEFVGLKSGKMSSRKGQVILGNDVLNQAVAKIKPIVREKGKVENIDEVAETIAVGAVKYSFLKISPFKYLAFDLDESVNFEGDSGPYVQYTYARAKSILKEAGNYNYEVNLERYLTSDYEINVLKTLERFSEIVENASRDYSPNIIATYLLQLSTRFNSFYKNLQVIKAEDQNTRDARLMLTEAVSIVLQRGLDLMGIRTVEKM